MGTEQIYATATYPVNLVLLIIAVQLHQVGTCSTVGSHMAWQGTQVHMGQPGDLHMTVFMTSHPFDVQRDPFKCQGELPAWSAAASQADADRECNAVQQLSLNAHPPDLQVSSRLKSSDQVA